ncbi:hypothetical protein K466DRAFT_445605, partial [Polyporus arcularius HHB13444]
SAAIGGYQAGPPITTASGYLGQTAPAANLRDSIGLMNVLKTIDDHVGMPNLGPIPDYLRFAKLTRPPPYDGKDDDLEFNVWLGKVLAYCRRLHLTGPDMDPARLDILQDALSGEASNWFHTTVESTYRTQLYWSFKEVISALYKRFIITDSFQKASYEFQNV